MNLRYFQTVYLFQGMQQKEGRVTIRPGLGARKSRLAYSMDNGLVCRFLMPSFMLLAVLTPPVLLATAPVEAGGFCVIMADATALAHVHVHYSSWTAAVHAVRTAYPFGQVVPAAWLAGVLAA